MIQKPKLVTAESESHADQLDSDSLTGSSRDKIPSRGHALTLKNISHRFGNFVAVDNANLDIQPGELVALLGPSGCGKTTLLRIIAGFLNPTEGDVLVDNISVTHIPPNKRNVGIVFQNYALFPHMTVAENIAYGLAAQHRPREQITPIVDEMLSLVQMNQFKDRFPRQLSGGQQQRIALARCLAVGPSILLLDEPFGALDKNLRLDMQIEIKALQKQSGITTILVTHDQEEALSMADRIAVLQKGSVQQFATPTEIYDRPNTLFVNSFVGTTNLIPGKLIEKSDEDCTLELDAKAEIHCEVSTKCRENSRVILSIRPEHLGLSRQNSEGALPAKLRAIMPLGPSTVFDTTLADNTSVKVIQERSLVGENYSPGETVHLIHTSKKACAVFPEEDVVES